MALLNSLAAQKATILIHYERKKEELVCTFNPSQYSIKNAGKYKENKEVTGETETVTFVGVKQRVLSVSLFFDSAYSLSQKMQGIKFPVGDLNSSLIPSVTEFTGKLENAVMVDGNLHTPPQVTFLWGDLEFKGVLTDLNQTFTMFNLFGKPLRAKVDLTIQAMETLASKSSPLQSPDRTKCRVITAGMSLWGIAYEEYGDCEKWRLIANANQLMNPLDIKEGTTIKVPAL